MRIIMWFFYLILVIAGVSFSFLNASLVQINLYIKTITLPLSLVLAVTLGIGTLIGFMLFIFRYWRLKLDNHKLHNQLKLTEKEIKNLRAIPLQD